MASGRSERVYHQDYIARIRYSNTLPPPPNPPKLLDIPGTGLSGGQYTSAAFASRLAREQPLNIEADAELGMPIDLVGLPGVFDGNERAIMARDPPLPLHPSDRALLKPLSALGKSSNTAGGVSFLRRTEYISSNQGSQRFESSTSKDLLKLRENRKRGRKETVNKEDPATILRYIVKGFDIAYPKDAHTGPETSEKVRGADITEADTRAWAKPKHPTKPDLQLLDSYPVLPDLDALPGVGSYIVTKFNTNPSAITDHYDPCLDVAILRPQNANTERQEDRLAAYETDLTMTKPTTEYDYEFYMTDDRQTVRGIKRKFNVNDPENDDPSLYAFEDESGNRSFKFSRIRAYETYQQAGDADDAYADSVALALHDPDMDLSHVPGSIKRLKKGAYFYPVLQRTSLRPKRLVHGQRQDEQQIIDGLRITVSDPDAAETNRRLGAQSQLDPTVTVPEPPQDEDDDIEGVNAEA